MEQLAHVANEIYHLGYISFILGIKERCHCMC